MTRSLSKRQLAFLQFAATGPTVIVSLPGLVIAAAGHDATYAVLLAGVVGLAIDFLIVTAVGTGSPTDLFQSAWGGAGKIFGVFYAGALFLGIAAIWMEFLGLVQAEMLPRTPPWAVGGLALFVVATLTRGGALGVARSTDLLLPVVGSLALLIFLGTGTEVRLIHLLPWWPESGRTIWRAFWLPTAFLGQGMLGAAFIGQVEQPELGGLRRAILLGQSGAALSLFLTVVIAVGALGPVFARQFMLPFFQVLHNLRVGEFLTRNEIWFLPIWIGLMYSKLAIWSIAVGDVARYTVGRWSPTLWYWLLPAVGLGVALTHTTSESRVAFLQVEGVEVAIPIMITVIFLSGLWRWFRGHAR